MAGSFKLITLIYLFGLLSSCSEKNTLKEEGNKLLQQNFNIFLTDLPVFPSTENKDGVLPIVVNDNVNINYLVTEECKEDCFDKINEEGFSINQKTNYFLFRINGLPKNLNLKKIILKSNNQKLNEYIEISFSNFYINKNKAFVIVTKEEIGSKGGFTEVFFFKKINNKWVFYKKKILLIS